VVEAKNENIIGGLGQCSATMVAAQVFNQRAGNDIKTIYGAVTSGTGWRFLTLSGTTVGIDAIEYYIKETDKIIEFSSNPSSPSQQSRLIQIRHNVHQPSDRN
jgi:hypothetical protein